MKFAVIETKYYAIKNQCFTINAGFCLGHTSYRIHSFVDPKPVIFLFNYLMFKNNPFIAPTGLHDIQHERPERPLKTFQVRYCFTSH